MKKKQLVVRNQLINYYEQKSDNAEVALLFLHGWRSDGNVWKKTFEKLHGQNLNLYAIDFPGFGGSENPKKDFVLQDYAEVVLEFMKKLELKNIIIIGHSFGGRVGIKLAAGELQKISKLILVDSAGFVFNPDKKQMMNLIVKTVKPFFKPKFMQPLRKIIYKTIGAEDYLATPALQKTFVNIVNEDLSEYMEKLKLQTLIIWGEKDMETPFEFAQMMKNKIKNSELVVFEGAGHFSFLEQPKKFISRLKDFVN